LSHFAVTNYESSHRFGLDGSYGQGRPRDCQTVPITLVEKATSVDNILHFKIRFKCDSSAAFEMLYSFTGSLSPPRRGGR